VPASIIGQMANYLKEGVEVKASFYGDSIFAVDLPQFLELMVSKTENSSDKHSPNVTRLAILETGAKIEVPPFIEIGDIIKIDTKTEEYIQRM
jgi:elongation factor P